MNKGKFMIANVSSTGIQGKCKGFILQQIFTNKNNVCFSKFLNLRDTLKIQDKRKVCVSYVGWYNLMS